jgi:uncharacterized membrane protein
MTIRELQDLITQIEKKQVSISEDIVGFKKQLEELKQTSGNQPLYSEKNTEHTHTQIPLAKSVEQFEKEKFEPEKSVQTVSSIKENTSRKPTNTSIITNRNLELFIGQNLISKLGILITIIGVFIGVKYSIDNNLISPATRIALGYLLGIVLFRFSQKLKTNYEDFSAVLLSGAIAIMYFVTFVSYSLYGLFHEALAFSLMTLFAVYTVFASVKYNREVIAIIGLVGSYAIPFLLSNGEGRSTLLFSYMLIINIGILAVAAQKYWKKLLVCSFLATWVIFTSWLVLSYNFEADATVAFIFGLLFFLVNYFAIVWIKIIKKQQFNGVDLALAIFNAFIFYAAGYYVIKDLGEGGNYLGLFTLFNAAIHFLVSKFIYQKKLVDQKLKQFTAGMALVFIVLFVPIQLDGSYVTLFWALIALMLCWIGSDKKIPFYLYMAAPLFFIAFISQLHDWAVYNNKIASVVSSEDRMIPLINIYFLSSVMFTAIFGFAYTLIKKHNIYLQKKINLQITFYFIPLVFIIGVFVTFFIEITHAFSVSRISNREFLAINIHYNYGIDRFRSIAYFIYSFIFCAVLASFNLKRFKNKNLALLSSVIFAFLLFLFLAIGLLNLSLLRETYLTTNTPYFSGFSSIGIRYLSIGSLILAFASIQQYFKKGAFFKAYLTHFECVLHITAIWVLSSELINLFDLAGFETSYKFGLSILWGLYSLFLVSLGLWKEKKHLRIAAIILFSFTLLKLFFYDISHLNTISKVMVMILLGGILLIISYLYNKNKSVITNEKTD